MPSVDTDPKQEHEWRRTVVAWHLAFAMLAAITAFLLVTDPEIGATWRLAALATHVVLCGWYVTVGAFALHRDRGARGIIFVIVSMVLTIGLYSIAAAGAVMFFILYPHFWALLARRWAMVCTVLAISATGAVIFIKLELPGTGVLGVVVIAAIAIVFSLALGLWISRIIDQSAQRAELVAQLSKAQTELAEAERVAGASAERERLARDIHDTLAQGFASMMLLIDTASGEIGRDDDAARERLCRAGTIAKENLAEAREMIATLTPPVLHDASLPDAVRQLLHRLDTADGPRCDVFVDGHPRPLSSECETAVLRIVQEAVTNSRKHSAAETVSVELVYGPETVRLSISDDGRGFEPDQTLAGYGLPGMRQRALLVGGQLRIGAAAGHGVTIEAEFAT